MQAANMMCPIEEQYTPPVGYYDFPYTYVAATDTVVAAGADPRAGLDFNLQQMPLEGDSLFILRKVTRFPVDAGDNFMLYSPQQNQTFSADVGGVASTVFPIVPEVIYPPAGAIFYDIKNWASSTALSFGGAGPFVYTNQVLFQGVRRFRGDLINPYPSQYDYKEKPFTYRFDLTLSWTFLEFLGGTYAGLSVEPARRFSIPIQDHDFELQSITVTVGDGAANTVVSNIDSPSFKLDLYDMNMKKLMSNPVYVAALNHAMVGNSRLFPAFPVPSLLYPANSEILFEISSMLDDPAGAGAPTSVNFIVTFNGVRRVACGSRYGG